MMKNIPASAGQIKFGDLIALEKLNKPVLSGAEVKIFLSAEENVKNFSASNPADLNRLNSLTKISNLVEQNKLVTVSQIDDLMGVSENIFLNYYGDNLAYAEWMAIENRINNERIYRMISSKNAFWEQDELTFVPVKIAEKLLGQEGVISLNKVSKISPAALKILASHAGPLKLAGLKEITEEMAVALIEHNGSLGLNNLEQITDGAARILAHHGGKISANEKVQDKFDRARTLIEKINYFGEDMTFQEWQNIPDKEKNEGSYDRILMGWKESDQLTYLPPKVALRLISTYHGKKLILNHLRKLSADTASILAFHEGGLSLLGLENISAEAALALSKYQGEIFCKREVIKHIE